MKNLIKNFVLFIVLSIILSSFVSCNKRETEPANKPNSAADSADNSKNAPRAETKKGASQQLSPAIVQSEIKMLAGRTIKLEDLKGKVVLINLWATWCGPCRAEMPELIKMQEEYKEKGFEIVGLDVGGQDGEPESEEEIKLFAEEMRLNYELGWADEKLYDEFLKLSKFEGIPQSFLINREGELTEVFLGGSKRVTGKMRETLEKLAVE